MTIIIEEEKNTREIYDDENPRIYQKDFRCAECGEWVEEEEAVWIYPDTGEATMNGFPYHVDCGPPENY